MNAVVAIIVGALYAAGCYLMLRGSLLRAILALVFLSHGANLLIFFSAGTSPGGIPIIADDAQSLIMPYPDPLPHALVLTAIVISFGTTCYFLALAMQARRVLKTDSLDAVEEEI